MHHMQIKMISFKTIFPYINILDRPPALFPSKKNIKTKLVIHGK